MSTISVMSTMGKESNNNVQFSHVHHVHTSKERWESVRRRILLLPLDSPALPLPASWVSMSVAIVSEPPSQCQYPWSNPRNSTCFTSYHVFVTRYIFAYMWSFMGGCGCDELQFYDIVAFAATSVILCPKANGIFIHFQTNQDYLWQSLTPILCCLWVLSGKHQFTF